MTLWSRIVSFDPGTEIHDVMLVGISVGLTSLLMDGYFKRYQRCSMVRTGAIEQFFKTDRPFAGGCLCKASTQRDFGRFPVHDPIAGRNRRLSAELDRHHLVPINLRGYFSEPNTASIYVILVISSAIG